MTTRQLSQDGFDAAEIRRLVAAGDLERIRRGSHRWIDRTSRPGESADEAAAGHRRLIAATLPLCAGDAVVSHLSAALLWGLPVTVVPRRMQITRASIASGQDRGCVHLHTARLDQADVTVVGGVPVTTLARTVVDLARSMPLVSAVVPGDAALRAGLTRDDLASAVATARRRPGVARARRSCRFFDGRSESGGESVSRVKLDGAGLPAPELQVEIVDVNGEFLGRGDFYWRKYRTIGEFDGRAKYVKFLKPGQAPGDVVFAEKRREDAIRAAGLEVVRWTWDDLFQMRGLVARIERCFELGARRQS